MAFEVEEAGNAVTQSLSEILDTKTTTVTSPDGNIAVSLVAGAITDVDFKAGTYSRYRETDLEFQLVSLIKLIIVARKRSRREALVESLGHGLISQQPSGRDHACRELLKDIEGEAHSGRVSMYAQPGEFWDVEIREGSLRESRGDEFIEECLTVADRAIRDLQRKVRHVNNKVYGHIGELRIRRVS